MVLLCVAVLVLIMAQPSVQQAASKLTGPEVVNIFMLDSYETNI